MSYIEAAGRIVSPDIPVVEGGAKFDALPSSPNRWLMAIACVPCEEIDGYFVPTTKNILSSLGGHRAPHPINNLRKAFSQPDQQNPHRDVIASTIATHNLGGMIFLLDDIDVKKNWYLPPGYQDDNVDQTINQYAQSLQQDLGKQFEEQFQIPFVTASISDLLAHRGLERAYTFFNQTATSQYESLWRKKEERTIFDENAEKARRLLERSYVARYKHHREKGHPKKELRKGALHADMVARSAHNIGGYSAQGWFINELGSTYIPLLPNELSLMQGLGTKIPSIPGFTSREAQL